MYNFIKKTFLFTVLSIIILIIAGKLYLDNYLSIIYSERAFKLPNDVYTIFFGDSHCLTTFNPEIIDNSFNAGKDSESLFHTFYKIKALLQSNPQTKKVVLSYSYNNLALAENVNVLYSERYYSLFDEAGKSTVLTASNGYLLRFEYGSINKYPQKAIASLKHFGNASFLWLKYDFGFPIDANDYLNFFVSMLKNSPDLYSHPLFQGVYKSTKSNLTKSVIDRAIKMHYHFENEENESKIMIESLFKIAELCEKMGTQLILINTPLHSSYIDNIPKYYIHLHENVLIKLQNKYSNIQYYDFSSVNYPDSLFGDGDHLNYHGIARFSEETKGLFNTNQN